jgi:hypothetical protein
MAMGHVAGPVTAAATAICTYSLLFLCLEFELELDELVPAEGDDIAASLQSNATDRCSVLCDLLSAL